MAEPIKRSMQDYNSSGECSEFKIGGTGAVNEVHPVGYTGLMVFENSADITLSLTSVFTKVAIFDVISIDSSRGHLTYDVGQSRLIANSTGIYKERIELSCEFANNVDAEFSFYVNGVIVDENKNPIFTGRGAGKLVQITTNRILNLTAGDYLEIFAKIDSDGDLIIKSSDASVEKTDY